MGRHPPHLHGRPPVKVATGSARRRLARSIRPTEMADTGCGCRAARQRRRRPSLPFARFEPLGRNPVRLGASFPPRGRPERGEHGLRVRRVDPDAVRPCSMASIRPSWTRAAFAQWCAPASLPVTRAPWTPRVQEVAGQDHLKPQGSVGGRSRPAPRCAPDAGSAAATTAGLGNDLGAERILRRHPPGRRSAHLAQLRAGQRRPARSGFRHDRSQAETRTPFRSVGAWTPLALVSGSGGRWADVGGGCVHAG